MRRALAGALVALFAVTTVAATIGLWADRTALRTNRFVDATRSLPRDPTVNRALATFLTDELLSALDLTRRAEEALPDDLRFLVGPLEGIVHDYTRDAVGDVLRSDQFQRIWVDAVRVSHEEAVAVLRDDVDVPSVVRDDGEVTLDLLPAAHEILQRVIARGPGFFGDVELPDLDDDATRREIRDALSEEFGVELSPDFGQITVFDEDKLSGVQDIVALVERLVRLLVVGSVVLLVAALTLSDDRRRTLVQLGVAVAIAIYLVFTIVRRVVADLVDLVPEGQIRDAVRAAAAVVADGLRDRAWFVLVVGLVVAATAYLVGPGRGAVWVRGFARALAGRAGAGATVFPTTPAGRWMHANVDGLRVAGVVMVMVALLELDSSWAGVVLGLAVLAVYQAALVWVARADAQ
ncbi:MAG TPA: hypothetical protein VMQ81_00320 [Acidimicrobiia bacterium]|nr:hypothetical protein [Acidimicrobiia bacterium]